MVANKKYDRQIKVMLFSISSIYYVVSEILPNVYIEIWLNFIQKLKIWKLSRSEKLACFWMVFSVTPHWSGTIVWALVDQPATELMQYDLQPAKIDFRPLGVNFHEGSL